MSLINAMVIWPIPNSQQLTPNCFKYILSKFFAGAQLIQTTGMALLLTMRRSSAIVMACLNTCGHPFGAVFECQ